MIRLAPYLLVFTAAMPGPASPASGLTNPTCPMAMRIPPDPWRDAWRQYISTGRNPYFSVRFDSMPVNDPPAYSRSSPLGGNIWAGSCYMVSFEPRRGWGASGAYKTNTKKGPQGAAPVTRKEVADPTSYQLAIAGQAFAYNEAGEVMHPTLGLVGHLYCTHRHEICGKYAKAQRRP